MTSITHSSIVRVVMQQPAMPKYRLPVFEDLASRPGIDFALYYDQVKGGPANASGATFAAHFSPMKQNPIRWHHAMWRYATRRHADVLILSWNLHYTSLIPSLLRARAGGVPTILWGHGYSKQEASLRAWLRYQVGRLATALLFYNQSAAEHYRQLGADPRRLFVALNSLDQTPIQAAQKPWLEDARRLAQFRQTHQLEGPTLLHVSRLSAENRADQLLDAGSRLIPKYPNLQIVIIGGGDELETLREYASSLGIASHVRFLGEIYEEEELAPWFLASDVFCYPANIGLSLLHAFGYGLPVITSDNIAAQNPEIEALQDGVNGLLYEDGNVDALAAALDELLTSAEKRQAMGQAARRTVEKEFTLERMVDGMEAAVRYCAHRTAPQGKRNGGSPTGRRATD